MTPSSTVRLPTPSRLCLAALLWLVSLSGAMAQSTLGDDLDRAAARYDPAATAAPNEVDRLAAQAAEHYRAGRTDQAVRALDLAAGKAFLSGATGRAFELSLTAAEALRTAGRAADAAERFQEASLRNPSDPRAAAAHRTACQTLATMLDGASPEQIEAYDHLLAQHVGTWPDAPTAEVARWERVELLARMKHWEALAAAARAVGEDDPHYNRARGLLVAAHAGMLSGDASAQRFAAARADLEPFFVYAPTPWPKAWSPLQRDAALALAGSAIDHGGEGLDYARRVLRVALRERPEPRKEWRRRAASLLVVASLAAGEASQAFDWMNQLHEGDPEERRRLLEATRQRLRARTDSLSDEADRLRHSVAALDGAAEGEASAPPDKARAIALADAGREEASLRLFQQLAEQQPNNHSAQADYARALADSDATADREEALTRWRAIEARSPRTTDGWFEARLQRLRLLVWLERREEAKKLLALTRLLAPSLGGEKRRAAFEAIAKLIE